MRVSEAERTRVTLTPAQERVATSREPTLAAIGPPGSGKTVALAAFAVACRKRSVDPVIIVSHESGTQAFGDALKALGADPSEFRIATFSGHVIQWLRSSYLSSSVATPLWIGGDGATRAIVAEAARGLLDMTWPMFARSDINLDLPYLSKPETFLDEAASLFGLLQRSRIGPQEFDDGCAAGLAAFYGERTERATVLIADPALRERASHRGRAALRATEAGLAVQRKAERDICAILGQLYRDYQQVASRANFRAPEDLVDAAARWFSKDPQAAASIAAPIDTVIIDDAEDSEPALSAVLEALRRHKDIAVVAAGFEGSRIDGFEGRRSLLSALEGAQHVDLPPMVMPPTAVERFGDEAEEFEWLARSIGTLISSGCPPETIALLARSVDAAAVYARQLQSRGLPALMPASMLQNPKEMADLFALAAIVDDSFNQEHLLRVLSSPITGLSDASIWVLCRDPVSSSQLTLDVGVTPLDEPKKVDASEMILARNVLGGGVDDALSEQARLSLQSLRADLTRWRRDCASMSVPQKLLFLADAAGFRARWHATAAYERERLNDDLERIVEAATVVTAACGYSSVSNIEDLIDEHVVRIRSAQRPAGAVVAESIVGVKGLHFPHVFVAGVAHERFPRIYTSHAMAFSRTYGLIVRESVARGAAQTAKFAWYYGRFGAKDMYLDEERRALAYAVSRGRSSTTATGFGTPPRWAKDHDLLSGLKGGAETQEIKQ